MANKVHVKKDDIVVLRSGSYGDKYEKGGSRKTGKVVAAAPEEGKVIVQGINIVSKHVRPRKEGDQGGIIKVEGAVYADKVQLYCPDCKKGVRVHIEEINGKKVHVCSGKRDGKPCGHKFD